jgi:hypothetical protein
MRYLVLAVALTGCLGTALGQRRPAPYWSLGGYGNVLFPGTGHAPPTPPGGVTGPYFIAPATQGAAAIPQARFKAPNIETVVVPYPTYTESPPEDPSMVDDSSDGSQPSGTNSTASPAQTVRRYLGPLPSGGQIPGSGLGQGSSGIIPQIGDFSPAVDAHDQPTVYRVAFKDHSTVQALGYWMESGTLHYISVDYSVNQVTLDLIDREASRRLNAERGIEFTLPPLGSSFSGK